MRYDHPSEFFWDSDLTEERKAEIVAWVKSLKPEARGMLEDILDDTRLQNRFDDCEDD
jgi:cell division FtsZ-interacting protein ZapD